MQIYIFNDAEILNIHTLNCNFHQLSNRDSRGVIPGKSTYIHTWRGEGEGGYGGMRSSSSSFVSPIAVDEIYIIMHYYMNLFYP